MHRSKAKLTLLILFPAVVSLMLSIFLITNFVYGELREQREHFTQAIVSQLTASTADYLVTEDLLGLNVVLGNLVLEGDLIFASVYKTDNKLVAQAGKTGVRQEDIVTRDISFQNETAGYLRVVVNQSNLDQTFRQLIAVFILVHLLILGAAAAFVWGYADLIFLGLFSIRRPQTDETFSSSSAEDSDTTQTASNDAAQPQPARKADDTHLIMVMKIRPHRWLATHEDRIASALSLYRCQVEVSDGQDIIAKFSAADAEDCFYDAICAGLLLIEVFERLNTTINIKIGINLVTASEHIDACRKQTVYIASIAERQLLISSDAYKICHGDPRLLITDFHNSLTPTGSVYQVESLAPAYQKLIELQAEKLSRS